MVFVNSKEIEGIDGKSVSEMLKSLGYKTVFVAVERNGEIIPKSEYDKTVLSDGDKIEVVSFVGGG
ncbi:MAG: sulfur carrier protein ThiS [Clostridiales bacterium]|nr:sulfur carrier protein ThiS [Clostridiales bacterium]